jgi:hypothetical protein
MHAGACVAAAVVLLLLLLDEAVLCIDMCYSTPRALHHLVASNVNLDCQVMQAPAGQHKASGAAVTHVAVLAAEIAAGC